MEDDEAPAAGLVRYSLVVLRRGPNAGAFSDAELQMLQEQHLAHLAAMRARGVMVAAGPFDHQADETWRGLCIYRTSLEETRALAESDPSVRAGRMAADVLTWWTASRIDPA